MVVVALLFFVMELVLRSGLWDSKIKPRSYLGHGVYRAHAIQAYGLEKINWVTVGNSVLDWGLNHRKVRTALKAEGIEYARMTMGSSKFPVVQMVADWSVEQMEQLDGLVVGASASALGSYQLSTQYKVSWPFLDAYDADKYQYDVANAPLKNFYQKLALFVYFDDIKDYFLNFKKRTGKVDKNYAEVDRILNFNVKKSGNVCGYEITNLQDCVKTANQLRKKSKTTRFEREIIGRCPAKLSRKQLKSGTLSGQLSEANIALYAQNWSNLILNLADQSKQVKFFVLPEHPLVQFTTKPRGMDEVMNRVLQTISPSKWVQVHDLRPLFSAHQKFRQCELFSDGIHLNDEGKMILTDYLIDSFE